MEILHKYSFSKIEKGRDFEEEIIRRGIPYERVKNVGVNTYHLSMVINEDHTQWQWLESRSKEYEAVNIFTTIFEKEETNSAEWLVANVNREAGDLEPADNISNQKEMSCKGCGIFKQSKPYRVSDLKPVRGVDVFNIIAENIIVISPAVEKELAKSKFTGFKIRELIDHKTGKPITEFRELVVPSISAAGMIGWEELKYPPCKICGTVKYKTKQKGMMKYLRSAIPAGVDFFLAYEWWGEGLIAFHQVVVSNRVAKLFLEKKWKGIVFQPMEVVD
jgi:hypothetical protein